MEFESCLNNLYQFWKGELGSAKIDGSYWDRIQSSRTADCLDNGYDIRRVQIDSRLGKTIWLVRYKEIPGKQNFDVLATAI